MPTFGEILKALREERKETQEDIANIIGVSRGAISKYEKNDREPDMKVITAFANYFGVTIDYITGKSNIKSKPDYIAENLRLIMGDLDVNTFISAVREKIGVKLECSDMEHYLSGQTAPPIGALQAIADFAGVELDFFYRENDRQSYEQLKSSMVDGESEFPEKAELEMLTKNRTFMRIAKKIIENDLDIEVVEQLLDTAIMLKKNHKDRSL